MKELIVDGQSVLVDDEDFDFLKKFKWTILPNGYVAATVYMHRLVMAAPDGKTVDHVNENKRDNRKGNLEIISLGDNVRAYLRRREIRGEAPALSLARQNGYFQRTRALAKASRFVGVSRLKGRWQAIYRRKFLGSYDDEKEAARAYNAAVVARLGNLAAINEL